MGIGASFTSIANGDNIDATVVMAALAALNAAGLGGSVDVSGTLTGTTAGTAVVTQATLFGIIKVVLVQFIGYRNASVTEQTINLPGSAFSTGGIWVSGASKSVRPYLSGVAQSSKVNVVSTLSNGTGGGTATNGNATQGYAWGDINGAMDAVGLGTSEGSNSTGFVLIIGI